MQKRNVLFEPEYECVKALNCFSILCVWWSIKDREQVNEQTNERDILSERMGQLVTKCSSYVFGEHFARFILRIENAKNIFIPKIFQHELCAWGAEREKERERSRLKILGILCTLKCKKIVDFATYALSLSWHEYFG